MKVSMFNRPKPKQFNIKTRYYDAEKEAQEKRKRQREARINGDGLRDELQAKWHRSAKKKSAKLTALYILILLAFLYFVFFR